MVTKRTYKTARCFPHKPLDNSQLPAKLELSHNITCGGGAKSGKADSKEESASPEMPRNDAGHLVNTHNFNLFIVERELRAQLGILTARVFEGREVLAASDFARWLNFSGIFRLLNPVVETELRKLTADLLNDCGQWFARHEHSNKERPFQVPRSELEKINAQLKDLASLVAQLSSPAIETANEAQASLRVIEGGVK